jgi:hypothetical protein
MKSCESHLSPFVILLFLIFFNRESKFIDRRDRVCTFYLGYQHKAPLVTILREPLAGEKAWGWTRLRACALEARLFIMYPRPAQKLEFLKSRHTQN